MLTFMSRYGAFILLLSVLIMVLAINGVRLASSFTNEFRYGDCKPNLNCANCLLGWMPNDNCASGMACVAFWRNQATAMWFKACLATGNSNEWCNTGYLPYPAVTCNDANDTHCACRTSDTGDCPFTVNCACDPNQIDGTRTFVIDKACF